MSTRRSLFSYKMYVSLLIKLLNKVFWKKTNFFLFIKICLVIANKPARFIIHL